MHLAILLARYGYWTVLLGAFVEGETIVLMGGFAAQRGYLHLLGVIACAFAGSLAGSLSLYVTSTVQLSGVSTYTGSTTIASGGSLYLGAGGSSGGAE